MTKAEKIKEAKSAVAMAEDLEKSARLQLEQAENQVKQWEGVATMKRGEHHVANGNLLDAKNRLTYARADKIIKGATVTNHPPDSYIRGRPYRADVVIISKTAYVFIPERKDPLTYRIGQRGFSFEGGQEVEG